MFLFVSLKERFCIKTLFSVGRNNIKVNVVTNVTLLFYINIYCEQIYVHSCKFIESSHDIASCPSVRFI